MQKFFRGFLNRGGGWVSVSSLIAKMGALFTSIIVVRLIPMDTYGNIALALSIIGLINVFGGLGANWSLLRFGALLNSDADKYALYRFSIKKGILFTLPIIFFIIVFSLFIPQQYKSSTIYLALLSLSILSSFLLENLRSFYRIINKNDIYSKLNIIASIIVFLLSVGFTYFGGGIGYVIAYTIAPLITYCLFSKNISYSFSEYSVKKKEFFVYGIDTGLGSIANQALFLGGPLIAGYLNAVPNDLALFKVATIIPYNLMFIPSVIMTTDFVYLAKNSNNREILKKYYLEYCKSLFLLSIIPIALLLIGGNYIIRILFGDQYDNASLMMSILNIGFFFSFFFRVPLGNILAAVGKANWNVICAYITFFLFVFLSILFFKIWGMVGICIAISLLLILTGFISLFLFIFYLRIIK